MHLLKIDESGALYESDEAVDLGQPGGDIVVLTSADTEVALLAAAQKVAMARSILPNPQLTRLPLTTPFP